MKASSRHIPHMINDIHAGFTQGFNTERVFSRRDLTATARRDGAQQDRKGEIFKMAGRRRTFQNKSLLAHRGGSGERRGREGGGEIGAWLFLSASTSAYYYYRK